MDPGHPSSDGERAADSAAFAAVTRRSRRGPFAIVAAGMVVLAFALVTKLAVPSATESPGGAPTSPTRAAAASSARTPVTVLTVEPPVVQLVVVPPPLNPAATPHPEPSLAGIPAGTAELARAGPTGLHVTVTLPAGWQEAGDATYLKPDGAGGAELSIGAWRLQHVYTYPCRWATHAYADPPLMQTAQGQAEALSSWWGQDPSLLPYWNASIAPIARKPVPGTLLGYPAWYVEVLLPQGFDLGACDGGQVVLWDDASGAVRSSVPGDLHRIWVVDVDGDSVVIDATSGSSASAAERAELQAAIDSIQIGR